MIPKEPPAIEKEQVAALLDAAGETPQDYSWAPCSGGGNNRVFVIQTSRGPRIAKWYFSHPSDTRNRLHAEYAFLEFAHEQGVLCVPRPLACLPDVHLALYECIDGQPFQPGKINANHIDAAINFFLELNGPARFSVRNVLPDASEACFSISGQIGLIRKRVSRLTGISAGSPVEKEALQFVHLLKDTLDQVSRTIATASCRMGIDMDAILDDHSICISPSDFGFHNALITEDRRLIFIDFEYAGWDDPAKMACDFFCQPSIPVDPAFFDHFLNRTMSFSPNSDYLIKRARIMMPLFQIKWCCIVLNEFLPDPSKRRRFAHPGTDPDERRRVQLDKAIRILDKVSY